MRTSVPAFIGALLLALAARDLGAAPANFDAAATAIDARRAAQAVARRSVATIAPQALPGRHGFPSHYDAALGGSTFLWVERGAVSERLAPLRPALQAEAAARRVLQTQRTLLGVSRASVDAARLAELHDTGRGPLVARFRQMHDGIEVFARSFNVLLDRELRPLAVSGYFAATPAADGAARAAFALDAPQAIAAAYADLTGEPLTQSLQAGAERGGYRLFAPAGRAAGAWHLVETPRSKPVYYAGRDAAGRERLEPAHYVDLRAASADGGERRAYGYVISARDGRVLQRKDQTADLAASYRVWADAEGIRQPYDGPLGNGFVPATVRDPAQAPPRAPAATQLVTLAHGPISTRDPWLDDGATQTVGNNVDAYLDIAGIDGYDPLLGDLRATMTAPGVFDYPLVADGDPRSSVARNGAVLNLFYVTNWLHDFWYDHGFGEAAGNAQRRNYGRGGLEDDAMFAQGQDFGGRNNANMSTPPDGYPPRMQMYLWDGPVSGALTVLVPEGLGSFAFGVAEFGPKQFAVDGELAPVDDGSGNAGDGCEAPFANAAEVAGRIALIDRGGCDFVVKTANAQAAGATAVLIADNQDATAPLGLAGQDASVTIGTLAILKRDGARLREALAQGAVTLHVQRDASTDYDGTLDTGIIAHEFFHYVSNRLVGDGNGLINRQGVAMGEGWSDFSTLLLSVRAEDRLVAGNDRYQGPYGAALYVSASTYFGLRRAPYSTDLKVYPMTFRHIAKGEPLPDTAPIAGATDGADNNEVHAAGEIWANTLWEFYAALLNDPRYSFEQARARMQDYVIAGLKMTPVAPTYLEARDALLAAVAATDEADFRLAAAAFAKRGMGVGAIAPDRWSDDLTGVHESNIADAGSFEISAASVDYAYDDGVAGYCTADGVLDAGETAALTLRIRGYGTRTITEPVVAQLSSDADLSFANGGRIVFNPPLASGDEMSATTTFRLERAGVGQPMRLTIAFAPVGEDAGAVLEPQPLTQASFVNFDAQPHARADDVETGAATQVDWQVAALPLGMPGWAVREAGDGNHLWMAPDHASGSDLTLTSPWLEVEDGAEFTMSFDHWFRLEYAGEQDGQQYGYDGAVIELSTNGTDFYNVANLDSHFVEGGYNGLALVFEPNFGVPAFIGELNPQQQLAHSVLSLGYSFGGRRVKLRFRLASDGVIGDTGWMIDNVAFAGIRNLPFSRIVANATACDARPPHADAGPDQSVDARSGGAPTVVQLAGAARDQDGVDTLTVGWVQTDGPQVALSAADTTAPRFQAPDVDAPTVLRFRITVSDGTRVAEDSVAVTVRPAAASGGKGGGGALQPLWLLTLLLLGAARRWRGRPAVHIHRLRNRSMKLRTARVPALLVVVLGLLVAPAAQATTVSRIELPPPYLRADPAQARADEAPAGVLVKLRQAPSGAAKLARLAGPARAAATFAALPAATRERLAQTGLRPRAAYPGLGLLLLDGLPAGGQAALAKTIDALYRSGAVEYAVPDYARRPQAARYPDDTFFSWQWGLDDVAQYQPLVSLWGLGDRDINAPEAWSVRTDGSAVVVAVVDSGIDYYNPDFMPNLWRNPGEMADNGVDDDGNGYVDDVYGIAPVYGSGDPYDDNSHGSLVSGIVGAVGNNGLDSAGVAWQAQLMALKVLNARGFINDSSVIEAIDYVVRTKQTLGLPRVVLNLSFGGDADSPALHDAIAAAEAAGILVVAAAGNDSRDIDYRPSYPAADPSDAVLAVGAAATSYTGVAGFSNFGCGTVDVLAPGEWILGPYPGGLAISSGTSQAAAIVSGIAALVWSQNPDAPWQDIKSAILSSSKPLPDLKGASIAQGLVRADAALAYTTATPAVWKLSSTAARPGATVTLHGRHFGAMPGSVRLRRDGGDTALTVQAWSDDAVTAMLPATLDYGAGDLILATAAGVDSAQTCFTVSDRATPVASAAVPRTGATVQASGEQVWVFGGLTPYGTTALTERFDAVSETPYVDTRWLMPHAVHDAGSAQIDGRIYVVGGFDADGIATAHLQIFDPASGSWSTGPDLPAALGEVAVAAGGGRLYVFGGTPQWQQQPTGAEIVATTYVYDPAARRWTQGAAMPVAAYGRAAVLAPAGDAIVVLGGYGEGAQPGTRVDRYDFRNDRWTAGPALAAPRARAAPLVYRDAVYLLHGDGAPSPFGVPMGYRNGALYADGQWREAMSGSIDLIAPAAAVVGDRAYVFGGQTLVVIGGIYYYDASPQVYRFALAARAAVDAPPARSGGGALTLLGLLPLLLAGLRRHGARGVALALAALGLLPFAAQAAAADEFRVPLRNDLALDRVIVRFKDVPLARQASAASARAQAQRLGTRLPPALRAALAQAGATPLKASARTGLVTLKTRRPVGETIEALYRSGMVEFAAPDFRRRAQGLLPNDPYFAVQWTLHNIGQVVNYASGLDDRDLNAPEGWSVRTLAADVVVAVLDSGIDYGHEDLAENIWVHPGEIAGNGVDDDGNGYVDDVHGIDTVDDDSDPADGGVHGTAVAGAIGAVGNNGLGGAGVAWRVQMLPLRIVDQLFLAADSDAVEAIDYLIDLKQRLQLSRVIINASWGDPTNSPALHEAFKAATDAGILVVAAAGNYSMDSDKAPQYPANYDLDGIVAAGATAPDLEGPDYTSNYGCGAVDLFVTSEDATTTFPGNSYGYFGGTSVAAAELSGIAALVWAQYPQAPMLDIKSALLNGAKPLADLRGKAVTEGIARLDAALAAGAGRAALWGASPLAVGPGQTVQLRGYRFGDARGTVAFERDDGTRVALAVQSWSGGRIAAVVPESAAYGSGRLVVETAAGASTNAACFAIAERPVRVGEMAVPRSDAAYAQIGEQLWIVGGTTYYGGTGAVERFDTRAQTSVFDSAWTMPRAVTAMRAAAIGEKLYVVGGMDAQYQAVDALQIFDTVTGQWSEGAPLPEGLIYPAVAAVGGKLLVAGGNRRLFPPELQDDISAQTYVYDPAADAWSAGAPLAQAVANAGIDVDPDSGTVRLLGGYLMNYDYDSFPPTALVQRLAPAGAAWTADDVPMLRARHGMGVLRHDGHLYALHGVGDPAAAGWDDGELFDGSAWSVAVHNARHLTMPAVGRGQTRGYIAGGYDPNYGGMAPIWAFELAGTPNEAEPPPAAHGGGGALGLSLLAPLLLGAWRRRRR